MIFLDAPDMHASVLGAVVGAAGDNHEHDGLGVVLMINSFLWRGVSTKKNEKIFPGVALMLVTQLRHKKVTCVHNIATTWPDNLGTTGI